MKKLEGVLYIILASICFGVMPILAKLIYKNGVSTYTLLFIRFAMASIILIIYIKVKGIKANLNLKKTAYIMLIGFAGYFASSISLFTSYKYISVGMASMILYTYPVLVAMLSFFMHKEKMNLKKIAALIISTLGVYCLLGDVNFTGDIKGILFAFSASIFYSIYVLGTSRDFIKEVNSYVMTLILSITADLCIFIFGIFKRGINLNINLQSYMYIFLLALISTVIALMAFIEGVKRIGPTNASILSNIEPIVGMLLGIVLLNESWSIGIVFGSVFIILSAVMVSIE